MSRDLSKKYPGFPCASIRLFVPPRVEGDALAPTGAKEGGAASSFDGKIPRGLATLLLVYPLCPEGLSPEMDAQLMEMARRVAMA